MNGNIWIIIGIIACALGAFSLPYGFHLKAQERKQSVESQPTSTNKVKESNISGEVIGGNNTEYNIKADEVYNVKSEKQSGGITAGKIERVNIITDKESLGIREPNGLYQNGKKVGTVKNFNANESSKTFTISEIEFYKPLRDPNVVWQPYEYQEYVIQIRHIDTLVSLMPPGAKGISGNILGKNK